MSTCIVIFYFSDDCKSRPKQDTVKLKAKKGKFSFNLFMLPYIQCMKSACSLTDHGLAYVTSQTA